MAGRNSDDMVPTTARSASVSPGEVLVFSFVEPKSYIATSYPHPTKEAKEANPNETRNIALSRNIPSSLLKRIESLTSHEETSENPDKTRLYTLKPGYFFMHITCWRSNPPDAEDESYIPFERSKEALWLIYTWTDRPSHRWLDGRNPANPQDVHPTLGEYLRDIHEGAILGGNPSQFSLGETSESFFLRLSDENRNWHYRYNGLPKDCNLAIQRSMAASKLYKDSNDPPCPHNLQHWAFGRLRSVALGQGEGWILYREEQSETLYGGKYLPHLLLEALEYGRQNNLVINVSHIIPVKSLASELKQCE
jgi:hypothetical protein